MTITTQQILDSNGVARSTFSAGENITLKINTMLNAALCVSPAQCYVYYTFKIADPAGRIVFTQTGNTTMGNNPGPSGAAVSDLPTTLFFDTGGTYSFIAHALTAPAGITPVIVAQQSMPFTIVAPYVNLSTPFNGQTNVADPLTFTWNASGAYQYQIEVDVNSGFTTPIWQATSNTMSITYPQNPPANQQLLSGTTYYWTVKALDSTGRVIAQASQPFTFTRQSNSSSQSHDLAITNLGFMDWSGALVSSITLARNSTTTIAIQVQNNGTQTENNVPVYLYINGQPQPVYTLSTIGAGQSTKVQFSYFYDGSVSSFTAGGNVDIADDYPTNNLLSKQLTINNSASSTSGSLNQATPGPTPTPGSTLTCDQAWAIVRSYAQGSAGDLSGYNLVGTDCQTIIDLANQLQSGQVTLTGATLQTNATFTAPTPVAGVNNLANVPQLTGEEENKNNPSVEELEPLVEIKKPGADWKELQATDHVDEDDSLRSKIPGAATIVLNNGSHIKIEQDSEVHIEKTAPNDSGLYVRGLTIVTGTVTDQFKKADKTTNRLISPVADLETLEGEFKIEVAKNGDTIFRIKEGTATVSNLLGSVDAAKGQAVKVAKDKAPQIIQDTEEKSQALIEDEYRQGLLDWKSQITKYQQGAKYASAHVVAVSVTPEEDPQELLKRLNSGEAQVTAMNEGR